MPHKINTFIIGAQKAGTTSLYDWLGQHPQVYAPEEIKDYHFFTNENLFKKGINHLESFYNKEYANITLHGAVNYMYFHNKSCKRIQDYNKDIKIIICLRNPIKRAISAYNYFKRTLREENTFEQAIEAELKGELNTFEQQSNNTYLQHGYYAEQIYPFINLFGKENCHFVLFEELIDKQKQQNVMKDVCDFLRLDNSFHFNYVHLNASAQPKSKIYNYVMRQSGLTSLLKLLLPLRYRKRLGKALEQKNIGDKKIETLISQSTQEFLEKKFRPQIKEMETLTGKDLEQLWGYRN